MKISVRNNQKLHFLIFGLLSIFFSFCAPFAYTFVIIALALAVLAGIKRITFCFGSKLETAVFLTFNFYLTYAIFGYPLLLTFPWKASLYQFFAFAFIWTSYVSQSLFNALKGLELALDKIKPDPNPPNRKNYLQRWLLLFGIMSAIFALWHIAYNPIVMSPDSNEYIAGYYNGNYDAFRSPVYAFIINIVCTFALTKPEVMWVAVTQNFALSALIASILMYINGKGVRFKRLIPIAVILPLIPSIALHTVVVWCDLFLGIAMLWLTFVLVRITDEVLIHKTAGKKRLVSLSAELCVSLVLVFFMRSNSFLVFIIMTPLLITLFIIKRRYALLISVAAAILLVILVRFPGYGALNAIESKTQVYKFFAGIHDIQETYYYGGKLSAQTLDVLRKFVRRLDDPEAKRGFTPGLTNYIFYDYSTDPNDLSAGTFISMYTDSLAHNPGKTLRSMASRVGNYWTIGSPIIISNVNCVNYTDITILPGFYLKRELVAERHPNFLTVWADKYIKIMAKPLPRVFIWSFGIWTALMLASIALCILQKKYLRLITYAPVFVYLLTLCLTSGWTDYRYGLSVFFIALFLPFTLALINTPRKTFQDKLKGAK